MRHRIIIIAAILALVGGVGSAGAALAGGTRTDNQQQAQASQSAKAPPGKVHVVGKPGAAPYKPGMQAYSNPPFGDLSYAKDSAGNVHLTGVACPDSAGVCINNIIVGSTLTVFRLPKGFRPLHEEVFTGLSFGQGDYYVPRIDVEANGTVLVIAPPAAGEQWISFDGIDFPVR